MILGCIASLPQLAPSIQLYLQSVRSGLHQAIETIPWSYLPTLVAPDILGNPVTRNDWFGHYAEWASYIGVFPLMFAFAPVALDLRNKYVRFYGVLGLLAILTAYQTPIGALLVAAKIPVLSTSALSRTIILFSFAASVLAGIGFEGVQLAWDKKQKRRIVALVLVFGAFFALLWLSISSGNILFLRAPSAEKLLVARRNLLLPSGLFILSSLYMLSGFVVGRRWRNLLTIAAVGVVVLDMLRFSGKWMPFDPPNYVYPEIPVMSYLSKQSGNWRVFGNLGNEALGTFGVYGVEGYDPLFITRYGKFVTASSNGVIGTPARSTVLFDKQGAYTKRLMDIMGVRYFFHSKGDGRNIWAFPFWKYPDSSGSPVYSDDHYEIYENIHALPRAYIAESYIVAVSDDDLIGRLLDPSMDLRNTVILEEDPNLTKHAGASTHASAEENQASIERYSPNEVTIITNAKQEAILFLSDAYYPGWNAYVNGQRTKIYRADYAFRAVVVPEGRSTVRFVYENWFL
ncbi:YfhO family protein [Patescibacteria group bacterium]|nr:YfhO family protein [Patescibacteria group bacterium]